MEHYLHLFIYAIITICYISILCANQIHNSILICSVLSLTSTALYLFLDAPDVAITETSVSVISTILALFCVKKNPIEAESKWPYFNYLLFCLISLLGIFLLISIQDLPDFGFSRFNHYYIHESKNQIGVDAIVTAILASYRGYDTLYETSVIFIGGIAINMLSGNLIIKKNIDELLIATMIKIIFPFLVLFAFYLLFHGEVSPGGGFQAGTIFAIALYLASFVSKKIDFEQQKLIYFAVIGIMLYLTTGLIGLFASNSFLEFSILGQSLSIQLIEIAVGITVSSVILLVLRDCSK
jgi:multicomponent Na+:H+ antiporter subunit B